MASAIMLAVACQKEENNVDVQSGPSDTKRVLYVGVAEDGTDTRAGFDQNKAFYWQKGDKIGVQTDAGFKEMTLCDDYAGKASGLFEGSFTEEMMSYIVYPYSSYHSVSGDQLTYYLPPSYAYSTIEEGANSFNPPMLGEITDGNSTLKHLASFFKIYVSGIPAGGDGMKFVFTADKRITGEFIADLTADEPVIETDDDEGNTVTISFGNDKPGADGVFYVPAPLGTYGSITVEVKNGEEVLISKTWTDQTVSRKTPKKGVVTTDNVAEIDGTQYSTLQAAFDAAVDGQIITLMKDLTLDGSVVLAAGKTAVLDLNGKTVSGTNNTGSGHLVKVANGAELTINDSSSDESGKITYATGTSNVGWTIYLEGVLNLNAGTIELTGDWSIGYAVDVRPNAWGSAYTETTVFNMKGGKLVSSDAAVRVASTSYKNYTGISANFNMTGGEIDAVADGVFIQQSDEAHDNLNVVIGGGKITSDKYPVRLYGPAATSFVGTDTKPTKLTINGGEFHLEGEMLTDRMWLIDNLLVAGGKNHSETGLLEYAEININSGEYSDLNVVKYLGSNADVTIKLAGDVEVAESITIPAGTTVTLDLNKHNLTGSYKGVDHYAMFTIPNGASLTVTGEGNVSAVTESEADNRSLAIFLNHGKLVLDNGTYDMTNIRNDHTWIIATIVDNRTNNASCETTLTINNGTYSVKGDAKNLFRNYPQQGGSATLTINDGRFCANNGETYIWNQEAASYLGELYFNGGTYEDGVVYEDYNGHGDVHIAEGVNIKAYAGNN